MTIYDTNGNSLSACYDINGNSLTTAYDVNGSIVFNSSDDDYDEYDSDYQYTILQARNAWATEYRADDTVIPVIVHTDQHRYLNSSHKSTFDYLTNAVKWSEVSAIIGLGDVCGAVYNTTDLNNMVTCLSSLPTVKRIDIAGNHDLQLSKTSGSSYAYTPMTDELFVTAQETYFNNSAFGGNSSDVRYGTKGLEYVIDPVKNIKFCVFACWVNRGDPWYHYYLDSDTAEGMIDMLSSVDDMDIVILEHIQPYGRERTAYLPAVDGNEETTSTSTPSTSALGYATRIDQLLADRKAKTSGTLTDIDGEEHSYDFTGCTSDLICVLHGHSHLDYCTYDINGTTPSVSFDAYRYDNVPFFFVNIDRTQERLNIWKVDESCNIYNFQVPFTEPTDAVYLQSITVSYSGGSVTYGTTLDDLTGINVTRTYSDGSTSALDSGWTLSGNLEVGDNTITLSYSRLTVTFTVTVTE